MPRSMMSVSYDDNDALGAGLERRIARFVRAEALFRQQAAKAATAETRAKVSHTRDITPARPGRSSTGGRMADHLSWKAVPGGVAFDTASADAGARHWVIQEIGTGKRAVIRQGGVANPKGRPVKGAAHSISVKSQVGRRLSGGLVFATPGGQYTAPGAGVGQAIYWASRVKGVPQWSRTKGARDQAAAIRIRNEIPAKHMVRDGGRTGFRQYRTSVLAAARAAFKHGQP